MALMRSKIFSTDMQYIFIVTCFVFCAFILNLSPSASEAFVRVVVIKSRTLELVSTVIGWTYFVAWSVSFYPQIWDNFRRKSVIGLNFDFLALNIVGFTLYGCYNVAMFWIDSVQEEYHDKFPMGVIPVKANDVFFPL